MLSVSARVSSWWLVVLRLVLWFLLDLLLDIAFLAVGACGAGAPPTRTVDSVLSAAAGPPTLEL
jgi:hypothetical protein